MNMQNMQYKTGMHTVLLRPYAELHAEAVYTLLTFHAELGAPAVFVNEDKHNDEEDEGKPSQTHHDRHLETQTHTNTLQCFFLSALPHIMIQVLWMQIILIMRRKVSRVHETNNSSFIQMILDPISHTTHNHV